MLLKPNQDYTNITVLAERLQQHLKVNKILITNQSGFR